MEIMENKTVSKAGSGSSISSCVNDRNRAIDYQLKPKVSQKDSLAAFKETLITGKQRTD